MNESRYLGTMPLPSALGFTFKLLFVITQRNILAFEVFVTVSFGGVIFTVEIVQWTVT